MHVGEPLAFTLVADERNVVELAERPMTAVPLDMEKPLRAQLAADDYVMLLLLFTYCGALAYALAARLLGLATGMSG